MAERTVQVQNAHGIHARPAAEIVKCAARFTSQVTIGRDGLEVNAKSIMGVMMLAAECGAQVTIGRDGLEVNAKSIMGVMMLAAECGAQVTIRADGPDAQTAIDAIAALIAGRFGES